jgi:hypothetical protein
MEVQKLWVFLWNLEMLWGGNISQNLAQKHVGINYKNSNLAGIRNAISNKICIN